MFATFEMGDPAISFSRYTGMARGPNNGVAQRHDLVDELHELITVDERITHLRAIFRSSGLIPYGSSAGGLNEIGK